jgi:hypothetical protein
MSAFSGAYVWLSSPNLLFLGVIFFFIYLKKKKEKESKEIDHVTASTYFKVILDRKHRPGS